MDEDAPTWLPPLDSFEDQAKEFQQSPRLPGGPLGFVEQHRHVVEVPKPRRPSNSLECIKAEAELLGLHGGIQK
jgi:hypothetical protein